MPDVVLTCGQTVTVDDEDYEFVLSKSWYTRRRQDRPMTIIHDEYRAGRRFRVFLHRAIAIRVRPDMIPRAHYLKVKCKNGDYSDVRRINLQITVARSNPGDIRTKPQGWLWRFRKLYGKGLTIDERDVAFTATPLWTGGFYKTRTRAGPEGRRQHVTTFAGRVVVGEDGRSRSELFRDYERRLYADGGKHQGGSDHPDGDAPVLVLGEDEGG